MPGAVDRVAGEGAADHPLDAALEFVDALIAWVAGGAEAEALGVQRVGGSGEAGRVHAAGRLRAHVGLGAGEIEHVRRVHPLELAGRGDQLAVDMQPVAGAVETDADIGPLTDRCMGGDVLRGVGGECKWRLLLVESGIVAKDGQRGLFARSRRHSIAYNRIAVGVGGRIVVSQPHPAVDGPGIAKRFGAADVDSQIAVGAVEIAG